MNALQSFFARPGRLSQDTGSTAALFAGVLCPITPILHFSITPSLHHLTALQICNIPERFQSACGGNVLAKRRTTNVKHNNQPKIMKETFYKSCSQPRIGFLAGALAIAVSSLLAGRYVLAKDVSKAPPVHLTVNENDLPREGKYITSFAPVVKRVAPSVVKVYITTKAKM